MMLYIILTIVFIFCATQIPDKSIVRINGFRKEINIFVASSFFILLFLYSMRGDSVGWDTRNYFMYFNNLDTFGYNSFLEKGWVFLMNIIHRISTHHIFYNLIIGLIGISSFYVAISKLSKNISLSIILYIMQGLWFNLMNQQRNAMAACICMIGFYFLINRKYIKAGLFNLVAFLIHDSALVFSLFILFDMLMGRLGKKSYIIFGAGAVFVTLFYQPIYSFLVALFYPSYTTEARLIKETAGGNLKMMSFYLVILIIIYYINSVEGISGFLSAREQNIAFIDRVFIKREEYLLYLAMMFSLFFQFISINNTMIARFSNYFSVYLTVLIPNSLFRIKSKKIKLQYTILILMLYFVYMLIYLKFSENGFGRDKVIPYVFYRD